MARKRRNSKDGKSLVSGSNEETNRGSSAGRQRKSLIILVFISLAAISSTTSRGVINYYTHSSGRVEIKMDDIVTVPLQPAQEKIMGVEHYFMLPKETFEKPTGVMVVLHSCKRSGLEFFHLPEDRIVAYDALEKGLAVLAVTSQDRTTGCFANQDVAWVAQVVDEWTATHGLGEIPRVGLAVSSGASFLFFVYKALKLESIAIYGSPQFFLPDDMMDNLAIPTVFVTMSQDKAMTKRIHKNHEQLLRANVAAQLFRVSPHPFTTGFCMSRFPEVMSLECENIFQAIQKEHPNLLDKDGFVQKDPTDNEWQMLFDGLDLDSKTDELYYQTQYAFSGHSWLRASLEEEIRSSKGHHAMTSEHHANVLDFLIQNGCKSD